jgi:hypothetical protein
LIKVNFVIYVKRARLNHPGGREDPVKRETPPEHQFKETAHQKRRDSIRTPV